MKPKIYISHPDPSIEEVAKRAGVSKRRTKEPIALTDEINGSKVPRPVRSNGGPSARKHPARTAAKEIMKPRPKICISHPRLSLEETAKMVGVSKRRLQELKVIIADLIESEAPPRSKLAGKPSVYSARPHAEPSEPVPFRAANVR